MYNPLFFHNHPVLAGASAGTRRSHRPPCQENHRVQQKSLGFPVFAVRVFFDANAPTILSRRTFQLRKLRLGCNCVLLAQLGERCWGGKKSFIMSPLLDLLNHQFPSNHVSVDLVSRTVSVVVGPDGVKEGSEVMLSYGAKCNPMLLATYGFAVTQNSVECNL